MDGCGAEEAGAVGVLPAGLTGVAMKPPPAGTVPKYSAASAGSVLFAVTGTRRLFRPCEVQPALGIKPHPRPESMAHTVTSTLTWRGLSCTQEVQGSVATHIVCATVGTIHVAQW